MPKQPRHSPTFIKAWRIHRGLSQEKLAERIGMSKGNISQLENGHIPYGQETLEKIALALNCAPSDLLERHPDESEPLWAIIKRLAPADRKRLMNLAEALERSNLEPADNADGRRSGSEVSAVERKRKVA